MVLPMKFSGLEFASMQSLRREICHAQSPSLEVAIMHCLTIALSPGQITAFMQSSRYEISFAQSSSLELAIMHCLRFELSCLQASTPEFSDEYVLVPTTTPTEL